MSSSYHTTLICDIYSKIFSYFSFLKGVMNNCLPVLNAKDIPQFHFLAISSI